MSFTIRTQLHFCYGHRLLNYQGPCQNLHGHNALVEFELQAQSLNELGMVEDFSVVKKTMNQWIQDHLDHRMILHHSDPYISYFQQQNEPLYITEKNPTAEHLAEILFKKGYDLGLHMVKVTLWETVTSCATYQETNRI